MNRRITSVGVLLVLLTMGLLAFPIVFTGSETFDVEQELGILSLPGGVLVLLLGASSPDPRATTVSGVFGNPEENAMRAARGAHGGPSRARFLPSPRESVNCRHCYTAIASDLLDCPRCARRRECRTCAQPVRRAGGIVRCAGCRRAEVYCGCPRLKPGAARASLMPARGL